MRARYFAVWFEAGYASTYRVKWSTNVRYLFFFGVSGYGPVTSIELTSKGNVGASLSQTEAICFRELLRF